MYSRFFARGLKLDYPNQETSKASKKYVRAMKSLPVCHALGFTIAIAELATGGHSRDFSIQ